MRSRCLVLGFVLMLACDAPDQGTVAAPALPALPAPPVAAAIEAGPRIALDDWEDRFATAYCELVARCPHDSPFGSGDVAETLASPERCHRWLMRGMQEPLTDYGVPDDAASLVYDPVRAYYCIEAMGLSCDYPEFLPECREIFEGSVPTSGVCTTDGDCAGDARCLGDGRTACGQCRPRMPRGAFGCADDLDCSNADGATTCYGKTCVRATEVLVRDAGAPCGQSFADDVVTMRRCVGALTCVWEHHGQDHCELAEDGALWVVVDQPDAACNPSGDMPPPGCSAYAGLSCVDHRCFEWGDGSEGAACDPDFGMMSCARGLACGEDHVCRSAGVGAPCTFSWQCASYDCEDGACVASECLP